MTQSVDPISLQVIGGALHSIAEQMGNVLYRMSYSSIIRESEDFGAALVDAEGRGLAEAEALARACSRACAACRPGGRSCAGPRRAASMSRPSAA